jgi:hypothetical protein
LNFETARRSRYYWGGGATGLARRLFELVSQQSKGVLKIGAANTETNAKQMSQVRKRVFLQCHFYTKNDHFTKTGSGQT